MKVRYSITFDFEAESFAAFPQLLLDNCPRFIYILKLLKSNKHLTEADLKIDCSQFDATICKEVHAKSDPNIFQIPTKHGSLYRKYADVMYLEGLGKYTKIFMEDGSVQVSQKHLKYFEDSISNTNFRRSEKSYIINLQYVKSHHAGRHAYFELNKCKTNIPISETFKVNFLDIIST